MQIPHAENIEGVKFWQIAIGADEANGEEYFGESDNRSSAVSRYLRVLVRKNLANCASFTKFPKFFSIPCTLIPTTYVLQEY